MYLYYNISYCVISKGQFLSVIVDFFEKQGCNSCFSSRHKSVPVLSAMQIGMELAKRQPVA